MTRGLSTDAIFGEFFAECVLSELGRIVGMIMVCL